VEVTDTERQILFELLNEDRKARKAMEDALIENPAIAVDLLRKLAKEMKK
jgi:hypothetical protein